MPSRRHDSAILFDWLMSALSYQGISDRMAYRYIERHGRAQWADIEAEVAGWLVPTWPKLQSYWHFQGCRYDKRPNAIKHCTHDTAARI